MKNRREEKRRRKRRRRRRKRNLQRKKNTIDKMTITKQERIEEKIKEINVGGGNRNRKRKWQK